jgi:hypothetical protein
MTVDRVKFQEIVESQLPRYVREDFPLLSDFIKQYYISQEIESGPIDILNNIDQYVKVDQLCDIVDSTTLVDSLDTIDTTIVVNSTEGFSDNNGIIQIDNEIIYYGTKTSTTFVDCSRGFSGVTTYITSGAPDELTFSSTIADSHTTGATVKNLNILFLKQFLTKLKRQVTPGFTDRNFYTGLDKRNFIINSDSFYKSKGTEQSYEILFRALYGEDVELIRPSKFLLTPSNADYKVTKDFVVEQLQGDPLNLKNLTIYQDLTSARGSVTNVQQIPYENFQYYQISIDSGFARDSDVSGSIYGQFKPNPLTKVLNDVSIGSTIIDVDSTIGFPETGSLSVLDIDNNELSVAYNGKTLNQFFNTSGVSGKIVKKTNITLDTYSYAYVGIDTTQQIRVRFTATVKDFIPNELNYYYKPHDTIELKSLGYESPTKKANNYVLNVKTNWDVVESSVIDADAFVYQFEFAKEHFFREGYTVRYENLDGTYSIFGTVSRVFSSTAIRVTFSQQINLKGQFVIENQTLKGASQAYPYLNNYIANVQNTYSKYNDDVIIASNSIAKYDDIETDPYDKKITFSANLTSTENLTLPVNPTSRPDHGFYTGDAVYFTSAGNGFEGMPSASYFVFRVDEETIKLSRSKADLSRKLYITFNGSVVNASLAYLDFYDKEIEPQGLYRQILKPINDNKSYITRAGYTGIFVNGVELLNYKAQSSVYYGKLNSLSMTTGGGGYDIINPPVLSIKDEVGYGATGFCNVKGSLIRLDVTDSGLGYYEPPTISISGGNGSGAKAEPRMVSIKHENSFFADFPSQVDLINNTIIFPSDHKFLDGEEIIYEPRGTEVVSGLTTGGSYYVRVTGQKSMKLHTNKGDAFVGINTVNITKYGSGTQYFVASDLKLVVSSVVVTDPGQNYENKRRTIPAIGVNTVSDQVEIANHGYESKEIVRYTKPDVGDSIQGLSENTDYYVVKVNDNAFSLTNVGIDSVATDHYYDNGIIINFSNEGLGSFNYPPIVVTVEGAAASYDKTFVENFQELFIIESPIEENITTPVFVLAWTGPDGGLAEITRNGTQTEEFYVEVNEGTNWLISDNPFIGNILLYDAKLQPIFRGSIETIDLTSTGVGYGSSDIVDFVRQPEVTFEAGVNAKLTPIINNGEIAEVVINTPGNGYNSPPDLQIVSETGNYAVLIPIIENGSIKNIIVSKGGAGYVTGKTSVNVIPSGGGARVNANIQAWNINLFEKNFNNILDDDGVIEENLSNKSLEYCATYLPRPLRRTLNVVNGFDKDNELYGTFDLSFDQQTGEEINSIYHSPIVGWAYDGNPIYGPYGFKNIDGTGDISRMVSGYKLARVQKGRPSYNSFPNGFFANDYIFTGDGDLDVHNGRFCVTPDYPNGVYAYFCTISEGIDTDGPFTNYRRPVFPYAIGDTYKSTPIAFNFLARSNQTDYDIEGKGWFRNTKYYYTNDGQSGYDYIFNSNTVRKQTIDVTATSAGSVDDISIFDSGTDYRVNDRVIFNNTGTKGSNLNIKVSQVGGKKVNNVSLATTVINDVEFYSNSVSSQFVGLTSAPHNFLPGNIIFIDGISESYKNLQGSYSVGVSSDRWYTSLGINTGPVTGIVTYVYVSGSLDESIIAPDDILRIEFEKLKVLNIDKKSSRIRVLRGYDNTFAVTHSAGTLVRNDPRKLAFTATGIVTTKQLVTNRQLYFEPNEAIGLGTQTVGTATTLVFANPGVGQTQLRVDQQQIYIPDHRLGLNTPITYYTNGGTSISAWSGITSSNIFQLESTRNLFAVPINKDILGIATVRVGIDSISGEYVGVTSGTGALLYFTTSAGLGSYHSFKTNLPSVLSGRVSKNVVTVSTASTHGIKPGDRVEIDVNPTTTTEITVVYDDYNRRMVFDPDTIEPSGINTAFNTFTVPNNKYQVGDKIIYSSVIPDPSLSNKGLYYVYVFKNDQIKLVEYASELGKENPTFVNIGTAHTTTISRINPAIKVQKNQNLRFNLSDNSLSFTNAGATFPAFDMFILSDSSYTNKFWISQNSDSFEVTKSGIIGVDTSANLTLKVTEDIPTNLWYNFEVDNVDINLPVKTRKYTDTSVYNNNQINVVGNKFDGAYSVVGITSMTFDYNIPYNRDTTNLYDSTNAVISYNTNSSGTVGPISRLSILNGGRGYRSLPGFTSVRSLTGSGALLQPTSTSIGNIISTKVNYIGFGYPSDTTLNAAGNLPEILRIEPLASFDYIGISSAGLNYYEVPELVVVDGVSKLQITDVKLDYELDDTEVTIIQNTISLNNVTPSIIPINNSNGFSISSITYNSVSKIVRLSLSKQFSDPQEWPFKVGETVIVENIAIGFNTTGKGYNSENYEYALFSLTATDSNLGGSGSYIEYDLSDYLGDGEFPGQITSFAAAKVTPKTYFPIFDIKLKISNFFDGEKVINDDAVGIVERWDPVSEYLFVSTNSDFEVGSIIESETSQIKSRVKSKIDFNSTISIGAGTTFIDGWQSNSGMLNDNLQVIPNNEYYQNFSYSLKSRVPYKTWDDPVSSLNHTAGFDKFADLVIDNNAAGIASAKEVTIDTVVDLIGEGDLYCFPDFDGATETTIDVINGKTVSDQIIFENRILLDYFESRGNRVLELDDLSGQFNSNPRDTRYSIVDFFDNKFYFNKFFTLVQDSEVRNRKQSSIVSVVQDGTRGFVNQYGTLDTAMPLGYFDYIGAGTSSWGLTFYPTLFKYNNYDISYFTFSGLNDVTGIATQQLGDVVRISTASTNVSVGTTTNLVSISSTYRSAKLLIQMEDAENNYYGNELNILHDGTNVTTLQYGANDNKVGLAGLPSSGFGTYNAYISGGLVKVDIIPTVGTAVTANVSIVSIADNSASGVSTSNLVVTNLSSYSKSIVSSGSPVENIVASYTSPFNSEYFIVSVEDTTNNEYEMFEVNVLDNDGVNRIVKYGDIRTYVGLGTVGVTNDSTETHLVYTPNPNINVQIRAFGISLKNFDNIVGISSIDLNNNILFSEYGTYTGTEFDKKTSFRLKSNNLDVFERSFVGNSTSVVNTTTNQVTLKDHYFVTGEKVTYSYENSILSTANAIGIGTTNIAGVSTDKLPSTLYIVKYNEKSVGFAKSAADALNVVPTVLDITSIGIGTFHKITATNQNARALLAVDNMIQSPVTEVNIETSLSENIVFDVDFDVAGIASFRANDLLKIDDEIMLVQNTGVSSENSLRVLRAQLGTEVASHNIGTSVNLLGGNYNIVDNTVHFASAPFGATPIGTTTAGPDNVDWVGVTTYSSFQGRTFMRSGILNDDRDTYSTNYTFDNIQSGFNGQRRIFTLTQNGENLVGFATNQAIILNSNILQEPLGGQITSGDYSFLEVAGVTSITYLGDSVSSEEDPNKASIPRGGTLISVGSTPGFGFQPLVGAGASVFVNSGGTINSISIGNSGSGYRTGIQTNVGVGIITSSTGDVKVIGIGTANIVDGYVDSIDLYNLGSNLDSNNPPVVVIDKPLGYSNIPLVYSSDSAPGVGTGARVDIVVGQGSSVINFDIVSGGFGYNIGDKLNIAIGGTTGVKTDSSLPFIPFELNVIDVYRDTFNGFTVGELEAFDSVNELFDGLSTKFPLTISQQQFAIESKKGSNISLSQALIITINDVLQVPEIAYTFTGGGYVEFAEPPKKGDTCKIIFYKGTPDVDVVFVDILETVKIGDTLQLKNDISKGQTFGLYQDPRVVTGITTLDTATTLAYNGPGVTTNTALVRPVTWCKQTDDITINGDFVTKDRIDQEPYIYPAAYLTSYVGFTSVYGYVDSIRPLFNSSRETNLLDYQDKVVIIDQGAIDVATATASTGSGGIITSFTVSNVGAGYSYLTTPSVSVSLPDDINGTRATGIASVTGDGVVSISVSNAGTGYTQAPSVLIQQPSVRREQIGVTSYFGDYGNIVGYAHSGINTAFIELYIPEDSYMRDDTISGVAVTVSKLIPGDFFVVNDSNVGIFTGNNFDGIYYVKNAENVTKNLSSIGLGVTVVRRIEFTSQGYSSGSGTFDNSRIFGEYTWGKVQFINRVPATALQFFPEGYTGLSSSPLVQRLEPLKFNNYNV